MSTHRNLGRLLPALFLCLSGCAGIPDSAAYLPDPNVAVELTDTPFFPQDDFQCGPAALATALNASGVEINPGQLVPKVYIPKKKGSLQIELLAATRTSGRLPYVLDPSLSGVVGELQDGRPVVVLQNLGVSMIPRWHYAVVVGINGMDDTVVLRSGIDKRRSTPINLFLRTWARGDFWAMTVLRPGELPATADRQRYLAAVADLEQVGMLKEAEIAWRAALKQWPDDTLARFGLGNTLLSLNRPDEAEAVYRELIAHSPGLMAARNNLAMALHRQGLHSEALIEIEMALEQSDNPGLYQELLDSKREIENSALEPDRYNIEDELND